MFVERCSEKQVKSVIILFYWDHWVKMFNILFLSRSGMGYLHIKIYGVIFNLVV